MAAAISSFTTYTSTANGSSYTSNTFNALGSTGRPIVIFQARGSSNLSPPTATIGGKAMWAVSSASTGLAMQTFFVGDEGDSGEVTVSNLGASGLRCTMIMYRVTGVDLTYGRDGQAQTTSNNTAINVSLTGSPLPGNNAGGAVVSGKQLSVTTTSTWTGLTEDFDADIESANAHTYGSGVFTTTGNKSVTVNSVTGTGSQHRAVGFRDGTPAVAALVFDPAFTPGHISLNGDNARANHTNGIYHDDYVLGATAATNGRRYVEFEVEASYNFANTRVGIADSAQLTLDNGTASGNSFYGFSFAGDIWEDGVDSGVDTGWGSPANGDRICLDVDIDAQTISGRLNNGSWSSPISFAGGSLASVRFAASLNNDDEVVIVLGDTAHWEFSPPSGAVEWDDASGTAYTLTADPASYTETGSDANQLISGSSDAGSYTLTGNAANQKISGAAASGSYSFTGQAAFQKVSGSAASGSYTLTVADATLTHTPAGSNNYALTADPASYTFTGNDATLTYAQHNFVLTADAPSYALTAADATLSWSGVQTQSFTSAGRGMRGTSWNANWNRTHDEAVKAAHTGETKAQKRARLARDKAAVAKLLADRDAKARRRDAEAMLLLLM